MDTVWRREKEEVRLHEGPSSDGTWRIFRLVAKEPFDEDLGAHLPCPEEQQTLRSLAGTEGFCWP